MDRTTSVPKSVLHYELDKVRYLDLESVVIPVLFFLNKEADGRDRVKSSYRAGS